MLGSAWPKRVLGFGSSLSGPHQPPCEFRRALPPWGLGFPVGVQGLLGSSSGPQGGAGPSLLVTETALSSLGALHQQEGCHPVPPRLRHARGTERTPLESARPAGLREGRLLSVFGRKAPLPPRRCPVLRSSADGGGCAPRRRLGGSSLGRGRSRRPGGAGGKPVLRCVRSPGK